MRIHMALAALPLLAAACAGEPQPIVVNTPSAPPPSTVVVPAPAQTPVVVPTPERQPMVVVPPK